RSDRNSGLPGAPPARGQSNFGTSSEGLRKRPRDTQCTTAGVNRSSSASVGRRQAHLNATASFCRNADTYSICVFNYLLIPPSLGALLQLVETRIQRARTRAPCGKAFRIEASFHALLPPLLDLFDWRLTYCGLPC